MGLRRGRFFSTSDLVLEVMLGNHCQVRINYTYPFRRMEYWSACFRRSSTRRFNSLLTTFLLGLPVLDDGGEGGVSPVFSLYHLCWLE